MVLSHSNIVLWSKHVRAIPLKDYYRIRFLVLELIGCAVVLRYGEIFGNLRKLSTVKYKLEISEMFAQTVNEVLKDLSGEEMVRVWRVDMQNPQQFSLTEAGQQELQELRDSMSDALMDDLLAIRRLFPSHRPAVQHP